MREEKAMWKQKQKAELSLEGGRPLEAEKENRFSPYSLQDEPVLPTPCLLPSDTDFELLASRAVKEHLRVV